MSVEKDVIELEVNESTLNIFKEHDIKSIEDVWHLKKTELKNMGVEDGQINQIRIKLQLMGLDLNKKVYRNC